MVTSAETTHGRAIVSAYLPLSVVVLADALSDISMIGVRKAIRETDYMRIIDECEKGRKAHQGSQLTTQASLVHRRCIV